TLSGRCRARAAPQTSLNRTADYKASFEHRRKTTQTFSANLHTSNSHLTGRAQPSPELPSPMAQAIQSEKQYIDALFKLTLRPAGAADVFTLLASLRPAQRQDFLELADSNHVVVRAFEVINRVSGNRGASELQAWAVGVLTAERARIAHALARLQE